MKCPYRVAVYRKISQTVSGARHIKEQVEYEECYEEDCPFYSNINECTRVIAETGGQL